MNVHRRVARNFAVASENKIHSDDIAKRLGFTGALVPGVTVFGHLTWPLTQHWSTRWLENSTVTTRFLKPAYDGETLSITHIDAGAARLSVECRNDSSVLLATLECALGVQTPIDARASTAHDSGSVEREVISWEAIVLEQPFPTYVWTPDDALNRDYAARVDDATAVFQQGVLHPHVLLSQANQALVRRFVMPAWIHTGSEVRFRRLLRVGDVVEVRSVPIEKWEKKGHQFIKLYIAYMVGNVVATEVYHTAIFRVAEH